MYAPAPCGWLLHWEEANSRTSPYCQEAVARLDVDVKMDPLTAFGAGAVTLMLVSYALEHRANLWILVFAFACAASAIYAGLART